MKRFKILSIIFAVIAIIGLISDTAGTRHVNPGAFLFPAILAVLFAILQIRRR